MTVIPSKRLRLLGLLLLTGISVPAGADSPALLPAGLTLQGFGTLGIARSSNPNANYVTDLSQPNGATQNFSGRIDSRLGLQANYAINEQVEAVAQGVSLYRYDASFSPELTWAFLKYSPNSNLSLRAGRIGTEFYMMADSRLVGYSYLTVRPPVDFFSTLPFGYIDGFDGRVTLPLADGVVRGDLYSGMEQEKLPLRDRTWDLKGSRLSGASLEYQKGPWLARLSYATIHFSNDLPVDDVRAALRATGYPSALAAASAMGVANTDGSFRSIGLAYDDGKLQMQFALARTVRDSAMFEDDRSGYVIAGYRVGQVTPFAGYSWIFSTPKPVNTGLPAPYAPLIAAVNSIVMDSHSDQHTISLGARWDFRTNMALKAQYDLQRGSGTSVFPVRREQLPAWNGSTNVFSLALDFIF